MSTEFNTIAPIKLKEIPYHLIQVLFGQTTITLPNQISPKDLSFNFTCFYLCFKFYMQFYILAKFPTSMHLWNKSNIKTTTSIWFNGKEMTWKGRKQRKQQICMNNFFHLDVSDVRRPFISMCLYLHYQLSNVTSPPRETNYRPTTTCAHFAAF